MEFKNIILEVEESIAIVKLNRPKVLNALNKETLLEEARHFALLGQREFTLLLKTWRKL